MLPSSTLKPRNSFKWRWGRIKRTFFLFFFLNWMIVALQCSVSFRCSAKWLSYIYIFFQVLSPYTATATAKSLQSCPTLCNPIDGSPPGSAVPGILQARTLEWVAVSFSNAWKWKVKVKLLSRVWLLATPWTAAYQAPPSMRFSRQEYWSGVPLPSPLFPYNDYQILSILPCAI